MIIAAEAYLPPITCPKCGAPNIPVYQLKAGWHAMGAVHLASHGCTQGGDHMQLQRGVSLPRHPEQGSPDHG